MDQKEFLERILPPGSFHYIAWPNNKKSMSHVAFGDNLVEAGAIVAKRARAGDDVYIAVAGYRVATRDSQRWGKISYRQQENVEALKCLFLDIDFKRYNDSPEETAAALQAWLEQSKLVGPTIIVNSGGGLHVYWTFPAAITRDEWQPLANSLAWMAKHYGLHADHQCTIDSARVLRLPETMNRKYNPPRLCRVIGATAADVDMPTLISQLRKVTPLPTVTKGVTLRADPAVAAMFPRANHDLDGGLQPVGESFIKEILDGGQCGMLTDSFARHGNGDSYELWNNLILLTTYAADGREYAHLLSDGDARYTKDEVDRFFDTKLNDAKRAQVRPTRCRTFANLCTHCAACAFRVKDSTPLALGRKRDILDAPVFGSDPTWVQDGGTYCWVTRKDGVKEVIRLFDVEMLRPNLVGRDSIRLPFRKGKLTWSRVMLIVNATVKVDTLLTELANAKTFPIRNSYVPYFKEALMAWINLLRPAHVADAFGWTHSDTPGFAVGGVFYGSNQSVFDMQEGEADYRAVGSPEVWQQLAKMFIADSRPEMQAILSTAFAAPLVHFTELPSTAVVARSTVSGPGKSTMLQIAKGVWGDPTILFNHNDTTNFVSDSIKNLTCMPWYWDELATKDLPAASGLIYRLLQGRSKGRSASDGAARGTHRTEGMLVLATNLSMAEVMQAANQGTDAGVARIFEFEVQERTNRAADAVFSKLMSKLKTNYGHAGQAYAAYLATHQAEADELLFQVSKEFDKALNTEDADRYWTVAAKTMLAGAILATRADICTFDIQRLSKFLASTYRRLKGLTIERGPSTLANSIYHTLSDCCLITDHFPYNAVGKPRTCERIPSEVPQRDIPCIRLAYMDDILAITLRGVEIYARRRGIQSTAQLTDQLRGLTQRDFNFPSVQSFIDKGIGGKGARAGRESMYLIRASSVLGQDMITNLNAAATRAAATHGSSSGSAPSGSTP